MHFDPAIAELPANAPAAPDACAERDATADRAACRAAASSSWPRCRGFALGAFPLGALRAAGVGDRPQAHRSSRRPSCASTATAPITVTINRLDFGQGVQTGLPMILAEELDADWSKVRSVHGNANPAYADPAFGMHLTGGSNSIKNSYTQYRELGARTRAMLVAAAAAQWKVDAASLRTRERRRHRPRRQASSAMASWPTRR